MFTFLLVVHALIAAALVTVILMQRSEGGGLGMGSGPSGLMTARGAADFLTRATSVLATLFVVMALVLAAMASLRNSGGTIDTSLAGQAPAGPINAPTAPVAPTGTIPMMGGAPAAGAPAPAGPDPVAAQALQPAAGGLPTGNRTVPAAHDPAKPADQTKAAPQRRPATAADLKTIDTTPAGRSGGIGINGVGTAPAPAPAGNSQQ